MAGRFIISSIKVSKARVNVGWVAAAAAAGTGAGAFCVVNCSQTTGGNAEQRLRLYGRPSSINVQKALWVLEEASTPFTLIHASAMLGPGQNVLLKGDAARKANPNPWPEEYQNPNKTVPALWIAKGPTCLWESHTIVRYISRKYAPFLLGISAEEEAAASKWMDWLLSETNKLSQDMQLMILNIARRPPAERDPTELATGVAGFASKLSIPEEQLGHTPYLAGDHFSVADIPLACFVCRWKVAIEAGHVDAPRRPTPHIDAWFERLCGRPAFVWAVLDPERLHQGLPPTKPLPSWHVEYMSKAQRE